MAPVFHNTPANNVLVLISRRSGRGSKNIQPGSESSVTAGLLPVYSEAQIRRTPARCVVESAPHFPPATSCVITSAAVKSSHLCMSPERAAPRNSLGHHVFQSLLPAPGWNLDPRQPGRANPSCKQSGAPDLLRIY